MKGFVAVVLHAHLPYVRHPEHARSIEERWLYEALWECYLPLCGMLDRLARDGVRAPLTISVSPPLATMLRDELLRQRFEDHLARIERLAAREGSRHAGDSSPFGPAARFYAAHLREARAQWERLGGDVLGALVKHHEEGRIELLTTTASHAYLPGLYAASPASVRAQLRLGLRAFEALTKTRPLGLWLPECAFEPRLEGDLARAGARFTMLDAHGIELASPGPPRGIFAPILGRSGTAFFGRDPSAARDVWSRELGYPGHPDYREFYRDIGFDLPADELEGELGPNGTRLMTGIKLHRVTGRGPDKAPYAPEMASARAREHAAHFLAERAAALTRAEELTGAADPEGKSAQRANPLKLPPPILVMPFDAELFGHWWLEGPEFLEHVLRGLDASARAETIAATSLGGYLARYPEAFIAEPATSSWGEGGFGDAWTGPASAALWRPVHHAAREVEEAVLRRRDATGIAGVALEQAIRELMLLQASDWAFMRARGEMAEYGDARVRSHAHRARRLAAIARSDEVSAEDAAWVRAVCDRDRLLAELTGPSIRDAFDPWDRRPG